MTLPDRVCVLGPFNGSIHFYDRERNEGFGLKTLAVRLSCGDILWHTGVSTPKSVEDAIVKYCGLVGSNPAIEP